MKSESANEVVAMIKPASLKIAPNEINENISQLWVDKYKPTKMSKIIGQQGEKLMLSLALLLHLYIYIYISFDFIKKIFCIIIISGFVKVIKAMPTNYLIG